LCSYEHEVYNDFFSLTFFTCLHGIWYYLQVAIIDLCSPLGASLYKIDTRLCYHIMTLSSSKCKEKITWQRLFIYSGCNKERKYHGNK